MQGSVLPRALKYRKDHKNPKNLENMGFIQENAVTGCRRKSRLTDVFVQTVQGYFASYISLRTERENSRCLENLTY